MTDVTPDALVGTPLARVAGVLWPSDEVTGHRLRLPSTAAPGPRAERYAAVPTLAAPRFLLPLDAPPHARARLLRHYNHLRTDRRRAQRLALAGLARLGLPRPGRSLLLADEPHEGVSLRELVADALGRPATELALSVGVRAGTGPVTPTVTVVDLDGLPRAFVKVAADPGTRVELDAEHDVLAELQQPAVPGVLVPGPIFRREWGGALVVGIAPLPLDVRRVGPEQLEDVQPYLDALVDARDRTEVTLDASPWTARLRGELAALPDHWSDRWAAPLRARLEAHVDRHGDGPLPHGLRHGDWSSWNMALSAHADGLAVWDWEYSEPLAPLGMDRCNWRFAYDTSVLDVSMTDATRDLRAAAATDGPLVREVAELFLIDMAVRRAGQGAGGDERSAAYADELVAVLGA